MLTICTYFFFKKRDISKHLSNTCVVKFSYAFISFILYSKPMRSVSSPFNRWVNWLKMLSNLLKPNNSQIAEPKIKPSYFWSYTNLPLFTEYLIQIQASLHNITLQYYVAALFLFQGHDWNVYLSYLGKILSCMPRMREVYELQWPLA